MLNNKDECTISLLMSCDAHYVKPFLSCLSSIFVNTKARVRLYFFGTLAKKTEKILKRRYKNRIEIKEFSKEQIIAKCPALATVVIPPLFSDFSVLRLLAPFVVDCPKVLYLDCDVIVNLDLFELFSIRLSKSIGVVRDMGSKGINRKIRGAGFDRYFNSGVILFNNSRIRKQYSFSDLETIILQNNGALDYPDQDLLNLWFNYDKEILHDRYNQNGFRGYVADKNFVIEKAIYHYCGSVKPWGCRFINGKPRRLFWKYASINYGWLWRTFASALSSLRELKSKVI